MAKKKEPEFIGRYGEILKDVKEEDPYEFSKKHVFGGLYTKADRMKPRRIFTGIGLDAEGKNAQVFFEVSQKSGKIDGSYRIIREGKLRYEENYEYREGLLHGEENHTRGGTTWTEAFWRHGKKLNKGDNGKIYRITRNSKTLRQLFSDASVKEAIKTGNLLKVKSAMTRAIKKREMGE